jgi:macrolide phosphotransferase
VGGSGRNKHVRLFLPGRRAYSLLHGKSIAIVDSAGGEYIWQFDQQSFSDTFFDSLAEALAALHSTDHDAAAKASVRIKSPKEARESFSSNIDQIKRSFTIPIILR